MAAKATTTAADTAPETSTEVVVAPTQDVRAELAETYESDIAASIAALAKPGAVFYSSFKGDQFEDKLDLIDALTNASKLDAPGEDSMLNQPIELANIIVQRIELTDDDGTIIEAPRVTFIEPDGTAYVAVSVGLLRAVENILGVLGEPHTWPYPMKVKVIREKTRKGYNVFTIRRVK